MASKRNQLVKVEVLPPEASLPAGLPTTAAEMDRLMEQKFAEMLVRRDDGIMQPYFQNRRVYQALKRLQSVPEQNAWAVHYERYRCTHCRTKKRPHRACGMCTLCYPKIYGQKRQIDKELSKRR